VAVLPQPHHQEAEEIRKRLTELAIKRELVSKTGPAAQQMSDISVVEEAAIVADLSMLEVQGSEGAQGVRLAPGATVVLSACDTGRGEIKAEGVVGVARGFLLANASAAVVSLWSVHDGSTAALMRIKYGHLAEGRTVPQALRLAMLRLARGRAADGLPEEWKRPFYWAGFVVVGATTRLPLP
jgi:CHAT domain-containing protein